MMNKLKKIPLLVAIYTLVLKIRWMYRRLGSVRIKNRLFVFAGRAVVFLPKSKKISLKELYTLNFNGCEISGQIEDIKGLSSLVGFFIVPDEVYPLSENVTWSIQGVSKKKMHSLFTLQNKRLAKRVAGLPSLFFQTMMGDVTSGDFIRQVVKAEDQFTGVYGVGMQNQDGMYKFGQNGKVFSWGWCTDIQDSQLYVLSNDFTQFSSCSVVPRNRQDVKEHLAKKGAFVANGILGYNALSDKKIISSDFVRTYAFTGGKVRLVAKTNHFAQGDFAGRAKQIFQNLALEGVIPISVIEMLAEAADAEVLWRGNVGKTIVWHKKNIEPKVSIVIPYYGDWFFLLDQLMMQMNAPDYVEWIYVCDDMAILPFMEDFGKTRKAFMRQTTTLVSTGKNLGFAGSSNLGASLGKAPYVLFMNSDIFSDDFSWLDFALDKMEQDASVGCLGFTLKYEDETVQHAGMKFLRNPAFGDGYGSEHPFKGLPANWTSVAYKEVEAVTGALMMIRKSDWGEEEFFRTKYILGDFEDGDLNMRVHARGQSIGLIEHSSIYHLERQSIRTMAGNDVRFAITRLNSVKFNHEWADAIHDLQQKD